MDWKTKQWGHKTVQNSGKTVGSGLHSWQNWVKSESGFAEPQNAQDAQMLAPVIFMCVPGMARTGEVRVLVPGIIGAEG